ncbi:hypothetical protein LMG26411_06911 [Cupriavidus numazuensis]|uniref:ESPR domain-containing protein n=1 Tax=Cupriavidus numazuensis TaxID=221992 RepID=A0ABM8TTC7_9BURK|nr:hypothetical protein LMG26411_06911 [Cupriavidus numazuensis]
MTRTRQREYRRRHRPGTLIRLVAVSIGITASVEALPCTGASPCSQASRARRRHRG